MNARRALAALGMGIVLAAPAVLAGTAPAASSSAATSLSRQIGRAHRRLRDGQAQARQLRHQVEALTAQQRADRQRLQQRDRTIAKLRQSLQRLHGRH